ncbi:MAG: C1 family peptidase [Tenuifilaceae bacterium]|nr:C1 family peptidase [Tenuifilaceae bacterium]
MRKFIATLCLTVFLGIPAQTLFAQNQTGYKFEVVKEIKTTPVKDQQRTGTCWSYATTSFFETELIRMGKPEVILSPMFFAKKAYIDRMNRYIRFQGTNNFGQGGQSHNVLDAITNFGMVPESVFTGKNYGEDIHVHSEMEAVLKGMIDAIIKNRNRKLSTAWEPALKAVLDTYFGETPSTFTYNGKEYSPQSFAKSLGINPKDYVEITSFTHHPFYEQMVLEIPDNWAHKGYYNVPIDELMEIINNSISKGYSVCWDGDVSEKGFVHGKGLAVMPVVKVEEMKDSEQGKWADIPANKLLEEIYSFKEIVPEIMVTQDLRQEGFDNFTTTDDHLMHIVGTSKDQNGTPYYIIKNSWGTGNIYDGHLHMSEQFARMKTVVILVHKDVIPKAIAKKMGL